MSSTTPHSSDPSAVLRPGQTPSVTSSAPYETPSSNTHHMRSLQADRLARGKSVDGDSTLSYSKNTHSSRKRELSPRDREDRNRSREGQQSIGDELWKTREELRRNREWDGFEQRERRGWAADILQNEARIAEESENRGDSIAGTRFHFMKIMAGFEDESTLETRPA